MTETQAREGCTAFSVDKATATHADIFAAVGLADLLADQVGWTKVRLVDEGPLIKVFLDQALDERTLDELSVVPGYRFLQAKSRDPVPAGVEERVDYEAERAKVKRYAEAQKQIRDARKRRDVAKETELAQAIEDDKPADDWRLLQTMYVLTNHNGPNKVHAALMAKPAKEAGKEVAAALRALANGEAPVVSWKTDAVQLFNPLAAKGYARLKPAGTNRNDKTKERWTSPFWEWLRYRGYFGVACPFFQGSKGEHIRVYTPVPARVSLAALKRAAEDMRQAGLWGGAPKLDALAVLRLAEFIVRNSAEGQALHENGLDAILGFALGDEDKTPSDIISGLTITHYQSLGSAKAVSSIETLAVPGWFPIGSTEDAAAWLDILDEHRRVVRGLDDSHSDEVGLLIAYRRFLEQRGSAALKELLSFLGSYGSFLLRAWNTKRRVRAFRTTNLERLVKGMAPEFMPIIEDPGFQAIARAVRRATVQAQFHKARGARDVREIRYDLLPELRRARALPDSAQFVDVVAEFVTKYNTENARRWEMKKRAPANIHTDELESFLRLIDSHSASTVGALLCAYGTCVEPSTSDGQDQDQGSTGDESENLPEASLDDQTDEMTGEEE